MPNADPMSHRLRLETVFAGGTPDRNPDVPPANIRAMYEAVLG